MNDDNDQDSGEQLDTVAGPEGDLAAARRVARLRGQMRDNPRLKYLLDDRDLRRPTSANSRKPWLWVTTAAGGVLALGAVVLFAFNPGSGSKAAPPAESSAAAIATSAEQPTAKPDATSVPSATPTVVIPRPTPAPGEGSASGRAPTAKPPAPAPVFVSPVKVKPQVSGAYGSARGEGRYHSGVDVVSATSPDFEIVASCDGSVAGADHSDTLGDYVAVDCGGGWRTVYGQMTTITVHAGDAVHAGQSVLGHETGFLHFEIRWNGGAVNPESYIDFKAAAADTPTPAPTATNTPEATKTPAPTSRPPGATPGDAGDPGGTQAPPAATPTDAPPTATPTATPVPPTPTATPTRTPTPRPVRKTTTPGPVAQ